MSRFSGVASNARLYLVGLADILCGCRHRKTTMPMTLRPDGTSDGDRHAQATTYIVCLQCGRHMAYDLRTMSVANRGSGVLEKRSQAKVDQDNGRSAPG